MKTTESRTNSVANSTKAEQPFFGKSEGLTGDHSHFFTAPPIQTKLNVGQPGDKYEREADSMADKVVQRLATTDKPAKTNKNVQAKLSASPPENELAEEKKEPEEGNDEKIQRKPIFDSNAEPPDDEVRRKPIFESEADGSDQLQRKAENSGTNNSTPSIESRLSNKTGGSPLAPDVNKSMGKAFGKDFSDVRVHNDSSAESMSKDLNAQAFTHGNNIYFNSGKYDTGSNTGKHLLAHELTHTIQQNNSSNADTKVSKAQKQIQRKKDTGINVSDIASIGEVKKVGSDFEFHLKSFPLKRYSNPYQLKNNIEAPKYERETKQKEIWMKETKDKVQEFIDGLIKKGNLKDEKLLQFSLVKNKQSSVIGDSKEILKEIGVPFWDTSGGPLIYQVEHSIDWQILGKDADNIDNLVLLDRKTNQMLGNSVNNSINARIKRLIEHFSQTMPELKNLKPKDVRKSKKYKIIFDDFVFEFVAAGSSVISVSNIRGVNTPYRPENVELKKANIPEGYFILKTSMDRAGYLLPYNVTEQKIGGFELTTEGDPKKKVLKFIKIKPFVNGGKSVIVKKPEIEKIDLKFENQSPDIFKADSDALAGKLRDFIGVKFFSPIIIEKADISPGLALKLSGRVDPSIELLKKNNIDISFEMENGDFSIQASISDLANFPKPFEVTHSSIYVRIDTKNGPTVGGILGFAINNLGKGELEAIISKDALEFKGKFEFESEKFKGSGIDFRYYNNKWEIGGNISIAKGAFKGVEQANVKVKYTEEKISGQGSAVLSVPGIKEITLNAELLSNGAFTLNVETDMKSMKGIKGGKVKVMIGRKDPESEFEFSVSGELEPNLPKVPNLKSKLSISYNSKGLFNAYATISFKQGLITGDDITIGVTNGQVVDGKLVGDEGKGDIGFYGQGTLSFHPVKQLTVAISVKLNKDGEARFTAVVDSTFDLFNPIKGEKSIAKFSQNIPVFGFPFLNISIHIGGGAKLYYEWKPLKITMNAKVTDKTYDDIINGRFDAAIGLAAVSSGNVGLEINLEIAGAAVLGVLVGGIGIDGFVKLQAEGGIKAELNALWGGEKGLRLQKGTISGNVDLFLIPGLNALFFVDLDLLVKKARIWEHKEPLIKGGKTKLYGLGASVPIEFDENGELKEFDASKITFNPPLGKAQADEYAEKSSKLDEKGSDKPSQESIAKDKTREKIAEDLREIRRNQSRDLYVYADELKAKLKQGTTPDMANFINERVEKEIKQIEVDEFFRFKDEILNSKETTAVKHKKIDQFKEHRKNLEQSWIDDLHKEVDKKAEYDSKNAVQKKAKSTGTHSSNNNANTNTQSQVPSSLLSNSGKGDSLPNDVKHNMESAIGADFTDVRIHKDDRSNAISNQLGAQAFAHGNEIYFNKNKYNPSTSEGTHLLAHELTHVVQQDKNGKSIQKQPDPQQPPPQPPPPKTPEPDTNINDIPPDWVKQPDPDDLLVFIANGNLFALPATGYFVTIVRPSAGVEPSQPIVTVPTIGKEGLSVVRVKNQTGFQLDAGGKPVVVFPNGFTAMKSALNIEKISGVIITHIHRDHVRSLIALVKSQNLTPDKISFPEAFRTGKYAPTSTLPRALAAMERDATLSKAGFKKNAAYKVIPTPKEEKIIYHFYKEGEVNFEFFGVSQKFRELEAARLKNKTQPMADSASLLTKITYTPTGYSALFIGDLRGSDLMLLRTAMGDAEYNRMLSGVRVIQGFQHHMGALENEEDRKGLIDFLVNTQMKTGSLKVIVQSQERYGGRQFLNRSLVKALTDLGIDVHLALEPKKEEVGTITASSGGQVTQKGFGKMESRFGNQTMQEAVGRLNRLIEAEETIARYQKFIQDGATHLKNAKEARTRLETGLKTYYTQTIEGVQSGETGRAQSALTSQAQTNQSATLKGFETHHSFETAILMNVNRDFLKEMRRIGPHLETFVDEMAAARKTGKLSDKGIDALWELEPDAARRLVKESGLKRGEQRRVNQNLPGGSPMFRTRVVAGIMLGIEVFNLFAPFIQDYRASKFEEDVAEPVRRAMWWQNKGVFPKMQAVNDRLFPRDNIWTTDPNEINEMINAGDMDFFTITDIPEEMWDRFLLWASTNIKNYRDWHLNIIYGQDLGAIKPEGTDVKTYKWYFKKGEIEGTWTGHDINTEWVYSEYLTKILNAAAVTMIQTTTAEIEEKAKETYDPKKHDEYPSDFSTAKPVIEDYVGAHKRVPPPKEKQVKVFRPGVKPTLYTLAKQKEIEIEAANMRLRIFPNSALYKYYFDDNLIPSGYVVVGGADYNSYMFIYYTKNYINTLIGDHKVKPFEINPNHTELLLAKREDLIDG